MECNNMQKNIVHIVLHDQQRNPLKMNSSEKVYLKELAF